MKRLCLLLCLIVLFGCQNKQVETEEAVESMTEILFIGTYTKKEGHVDGKGEGVYVYEMNKETGALSYVSTSEAVISPSYLAVHPNKEWLYAVNEFDGGEESFAGITAFSFDQETRQLNFLNEVSSMGQYPCHLTIDNSGKYVMAANYVGGSVVLCPIAEDGMLGNYTSYKKHEGGSTHPRQDAPHAHQIMQHPRDNFIVSIDLGADRVYEYHLDTLTQTLDYVDDYPNSPRMSGPRHMAFHPTMDIAYTLNELIGTIEVSPTDDSLRFRRSIQVLSTQEKGDDRHPASAALKVHPNGEFLYASNRGEINEIVVFKILEKGQIELVGRQPSLGQTPRDFEIDPSGRFLLVANQDTDTIVTFAIDQETGMISETGYIAEVPTPVCLKFLD